MLTDTLIGDRALDPARLNHLAEMLKALAQPTRLALLETLGRGDRCVCELAEAVGGERSNISRHLAVLHRAGIVSTSRKGVQIIYSLQARCIFDTIQCLSARSSEKACQP